MHSGSVLCPWASGKHTLETLSKALEVKTSNAAEILRILKQLPVEELLRVQEKIPTVILNHDFLFLCNFDTIFKY